MRMTVSGALIALAAALLISGCDVSACVGSGCPGKLDTAKAERTTKALVAKQTGADVTTVICPKDVEEKRGATFTCTAVGADGTRARVPITQTDDKGGVRISPPSLLATGTATRLIAARLTHQLKLTVRVRCPDLYVVSKGTMLVCAATYPAAQARTVSVTVTDSRGGIRFRLL